jgi:hypothetical protein
MFGTFVCTYLEIDKKKSISKIYDSVWEQSELKYFTSSSIVHKYLIFAGISTTNKANTSNETEWKHHAEHTIEGKKKIVYSKLFDVLKESINQR